MKAWTDASESQPSAETGSDAKTNRHADEQINWTLQAFNGFSGSGEIVSYLENFSVIDHESLTAYLIHSIRRGRCPAETKPQFVRWAKRQIDRHADALLPFAIARRIKDSGDKLTVRDVMQIAAVHGRVRKAGIFPRWIQNGNAALVDTGKGVLRVPAMPDSDDPANNFLPILQLLWPWHERDGKLYKHSTRQSYATGQWYAYRIPLHQLYAAFAYGAASDEPVQAKDGNFLNWCDGNLYRTADEPLSSEYQSAQARFDSKNVCLVNVGTDGQELWPRNAFSDPFGRGIHEAPVRPKGSTPDQDTDVLLAAFRSGMDRVKQTEK